MKAVLIVLFFIGIIALAIFAHNATIDEYHGKAQTWCNSHGYTLVSFDTTVIDNGPFYIRGKHQNIFKCEVKDQRNNTRYLYIRQGMLFGEDEYEFLN